MLWININIYEIEIKQKKIVLMRRVTYRKSVIVLVAIIIIIAGYLRTQKS